MLETQIQLRISGRVQGVGFRHFTVQNARELGVRGWVKNLRNGDVETYLEGEKEAVDEMIARLKSGPITARVDEIKEIEFSDDHDESYLGFEVKRSL